MAYVYGFFYNAKHGVRFQSSTGLVVRAVEDEAGNKIYSDNGFAIRWWLRTGREILGFRFKPRSLETFVYNRVGGGVTSVSPVTFKIAMFDGAGGERTFTYDKPSSALSAATPVPETIHQTAIGGPAFSGYDVEVWVGSKTADQRVDALFVVSDGSGDPLKN